jgi:hypothetical protein
LRRNSARHSFRAQESNSPMRLPNNRGQITGNAFGLATIKLMDFDFHILG